MAASRNAVAVGILLKRNPVILPPLSPFESAYRSLKQQIAQYEARPFEPTFYYSRGSLAQQRFDAAQQQPQQPSFPWPSANNASLVQPAEEDLVRLKKAPVVNPDHEKDFKSLDRSLHRSLYLVVKRTEDDADSWKFPQGHVLETESLHEAAPARLTDTVGSNIESWFVGNKPIGHFKTPSNTVFFMKAYIMSGRVSVTQGMDHAWMNKDELEKWLVPEYYQQVVDMVSDV